MLISDTKVLGTPHCPTQLHHLLPSPPASLAAHRQWLCLLFPFIYINKENPNFLGEHTNNGLDHSVSTHMCNWLILDGAVPLLPPMAQPPLVVFLPSQRVSILYLRAWISSALPPR